MNYIQSEFHTSPLPYQTRRLQELLGEIMKCCQDRILLESDKFGLLQAELKCLTLFDEERYLTVKGISQKMEITKSRVTKIIDGLVHKGLVERTDDPKDGRVTLISLTPEGKEKSRQLSLFLLDAHQKVLLQMKPSDRKNVLSALELLRSSMEVVKADLT